MTPSDDPGFAIYLHWPFCAAKCPYCDFNSHVRHQAIDQKRYVEAFRREIGYFAERVPGRAVRSIFFGGGTPSLMEPATVEAVLAAVASHWSLEEGVEITMEANPSSVEAERFLGYRAAGVNRVSLGVQALNDADLKMLGRLHDTRTALDAIETARATFDRLSFDLIYARPDQHPDIWAQELNRAIGLAADHLSLYQLTIEQGTPFYMLHKAGKLVVPDPDAAAELYTVTQDVCDAAGMPAYEISNHSVPGVECRHNQVYWRYGDYVGIGPGAHGRLTIDGQKHATEIERHPETWLDQVISRGHGLREDTLLTGEEQGDEYLIMGLRLVEGVDIPRFERMSGRTIDSGRIEALIEHGMIEMVGNSGLRATRDGFYVLDAVVADLAS